MLNGTPLPYVKEVKHLGKESDTSMYKDCCMKRAQLFSKLHSQNQEFHFSDPSTVVNIQYLCMQFVRIKFMGFI